MFLAPGFPASGLTTAHTLPAVETLDPAGKRLVHLLPAGEFLYLCIPVTNEGPNNWRVLKFKGEKLRAEYVIKPPEDRQVRGLYLKDADPRDDTFLFWSAPDRYARLFAGGSLLGEASVSKEPVLAKGEVFWVESANLPEEALSVVRWRPEDSERQLLAQPEESRRWGFAQKGLPWQLLSRPDGRFWLVGIHRLEVGVLSPSGRRQKLQQLPR